MSIYEVYCDGASRGQGSRPMGEGAAAVIIHRNKKSIGQYARGLGKVTNNQAEYEAILLGLLICFAADLKDPTVYSDSSLAVNQITGVWECHTESLIPLLVSVREIQEVFRFRLIYVPRAEVDNADSLVNEFLDNLAKELVGVRPPRRKKR